ncbi:MAG: DUF3820 family protein [Spirochaetaceae bacterium]|nr:DUF3820 family protein [Spirochaetaceae bacterium]
MTDDKDYPEYEADTAYTPPGTDPEALLKLANMKMPFGKYAGRYLVDLPENYVLWFKQKGFPEGELGRQMAEVCEIKANGLEDLLRQLRGGISSQ